MVVSVVDLDDPVSVARAEARHRDLPPLDERAAAVWRLSVELRQIARPDWRPDDGAPTNRTVVRLRSD